MADSAATTGVPVWIEKTMFASWKYSSYNYNYNFTITGYFYYNFFCWLFDFAACFLEIENTLDTLRVSSCVQVSAASVKVLRRHSWGSWEDSWTLWKFGGCFFCFNALTELTVSFPFLYHFRLLPDFFSEFHWGVGWMVLHGQQTRKIRRTKRLSPVDCWVDLKFCIAPIWLHFFWRVPRMRLMRVWGSSNHTARSLQDSVLTRTYYHQPSLTIINRY